MNTPVEDISQDLGGVIGLGYSSDDDTQSILNHMFPIGQASMFAVFIRGSAYEITFGEYNRDLIASGSESEGYGIHWFKLHDLKDSWSIPLRDARYGYMSFLRGTAKRAVLATGLRFIHVPKEDFDFLGGLW